MAELMLERDDRIALRARAHALNPVVLLGAAGLSAAVLAEIDRALTSHGLIKVRVPLADRDERETMFAEMADRLGAARVQAIGKLVVLFRPPPPETEQPPPANPRAGRQGGAAPPRATPRSARPAHRSGGGALAPPESTRRSKKGPGRAAPKGARRGPRHT